MVLAQGGSGSSDFPSGGGGGGGGSSSGGGGFSGGSGSGGDPVVVLIFFLIFGGLVVWMLVRSALYHRKVRDRDRRVRTASAEAAEDDAYFAAADVERDARTLFKAVQQAWDARDRATLGQLIEGDLLVEWNRRLDDFDKKGWHNRVEVLGQPEIKYVGIVNREDDTEDRAVVRVHAQLRAYVETKDGRHIMRTGEKDEDVDVEHQPATMTMEVELHGRRYVQDRDTAAVVDGSKEAATTFTERWTLALDGPAESPWRLVNAAAGASAR